MEKTFRITVEGRSYIVTVEDLSSGGMQNLYPEPGSMRVVPSPSGSTTASAPPSITPPLTTAAEPGDELSPLAGVVQTVHVSVGQAINEGDKLVSLEAMKMTTHVIAKRSGTVTAIAVKPGDPVDAGQILLSIQ